MRKLAFLLLAIPVFAAAAPASCPQREPQPPEAAMNAYSLAVIERSMVGNNARGMVMAAIWRESTVARDSSEAPEATRASMLARAADGAGPDAVAWAPVSRACGRECTLATDPFERWLALDPDNGMAWAEAATRALAANDEPGARAALERAARAPRFDSYWVEAVRAAVSIARAVPIPPELASYAESQGFGATDAADLSAFGVAMGQATPGMVYLPDACRNHADWQDDCLRLGRLMETRGNDFLGQGIGRAIQRRLLPRESDAAAELAERERAHDWRMSQVMLLTDDTADFRNTVRRLFEVGTEQGAFELQLRENGVPLSPPAGWTPGDGQKEWAQRHPPPDPALLAACEASKP